MNEIFTRRSIRTFQNRPVEKTKIDRLLRAAMQAPSALSQQAWEFIVVEDKDALSKLSSATIGSKSVAGSAVTIVLLANKNRLKAESVWKNDMGAAAQNILLEAVHLGLGAVWQGVGREESAQLIQALFDYPDYIMPFALISIGYPDGAKNEFIDRYDAQKVHHEKWEESK
ncbi:MAG: nitroreductase family protein [Clostridiales bacterium]|jgi:nitroreductase|nr:nitroreductase family protein [Clostridiales bacterium]